MANCPSGISPVMRVLRNRPVAYIGFSASSMPNDIDCFTLQQKLAVRVSRCIAIRRDQLISGCNAYTRRISKRIVAEDGIANLINQPVHLLFDGEWHIFKRFL